MAIGLGLGFPLPNLVLRETGVDPSTWSNLTVLLDKDVGVTLGAGGIENWQNNGSADDFYQGTQAKRPQLTSRGVESDGTDDNLGLKTGNLSTIVTATAYTYVMVVNTFGVVADNPTSWFNDTLIADGSAYHGITFRVTGIVYAYNWNQTHSAAVTIDDADHIVGVRYDGVNSHIRVDGGSWSSGAVKNITSLADTVRLFSRGAYYSQFGCKDLVVTNDTKTQAEVDDVITFLNAKRGVF